LDFLYVVGASIAAGVLSLLVAVILVQKASWASHLIRLGTPFAAGVLLIASFRDLIPHGIEDKGSVVLNATLIAIIIFFLIEKGFKSFHHHHEEDLENNRNSSQGWLFLIGSVFHNVIDGIALGSAFLIDSGTGIIATIAIIAHNIPLEVGEFGLQLKSGFSKKQTITRNLLASSTLLIGAIFAFHIGSFVELPLGFIYGGIAGFFIYIALSDIVPTIHSSESKRYGLQTGFLILGLFFGVIISSFAHQYLDVNHEHESVSVHSSHEDESESDHSNHED
jgi:zinc and cadmium transporter